MPPPPPPPLVLSVVIPLPPPLPPLLPPVIPIPPPLPPRKTIKRKIKNKCVWCEIKKVWAEMKYDLSFSLHGTYDERYKKWINIEEQSAKYGKLLTYDCKIGPTKYFVGKNLPEWHLITHQFHEICFWEAMIYVGKNCPLNKCPVCTTNIPPDELNKLFKEHPEMDAPFCTCVIV